MTSTTEALSQQDISWPQVCLEPGGWEGILGFTCETYFRGCSVHPNMASATKTGRKSEVSRLANIFNLKLDIAHVLYQCHLLNIKYAERPPLVCLILRL